VNRRELLVAWIALAAAFAPSATVAQSRLPLVAVLYHGKESAVKPRVEALRDGLRDLGYGDGANIRLEVRWSDNRVERLPALARELLALKPAIAVASPTLATEALWRESKTVPIVMSGGSGWERSGMIASLARPGGNVTGVTNQLNELAGKQLEFLAEIAPRAKRVLALSSGLAASEKELRAGARAAADVLGITLVEAFADRPEKLAAVEASCERERCDALLVMVDPNLVNFRFEVIAMAARLRVPAAYAMLEFAADGGLLTYSTDATHLARRAATYVDKILKGAKPGELPIERPTRFELVVNQKAAKAIGLRIPQSILLRADRVIE